HRIILSIFFSDILRRRRRRRLRRRPSRSETEFQQSCRRLILSGDGYSDIRRRRRTSRKVAECNKAVQTAAVTAAPILIGDGVTAVLSASNPQQRWLLRHPAVQTVITEGGQRITRQFDPDPSLSMEAVETGHFFPQSQTCKSDSDPTNWKELSFKTVEEYQAFYCDYAIEAGFSMRITSTVKQTCKRDGLFRIRYQDLCCWKNGFKEGSTVDPKNDGKLNAVPKDKIVPELRCGCPAYIKAKWIESKMAYIITSWIVGHNHEFVDDIKKPFLPCNRSISPLTAMVSKSMDDVGVSVRDTYDLLANCSGGRDKVGCTRRDLQNHRDFVRRSPLKQGESDTNGGHPWLVRLHKLRQQWSSAWVNNNRTCGMRSSQLSESCNASLRGFLDTKSNLPCFFREFWRMLSGKRTEESQLDYKATVAFPLNYHPRSKIVNQAAKVYTPTIFEKFQNEYSNKEDLQPVGTMPHGIGSEQQHISWYRDCLAMEGCLDEHTVTFIVGDDFEYRCTCRLFDSRGWLCSHILKTMEVVGMLWNKAAYIIPAKVGGDLYNCSIHCMEPKTEYGRFQQLCGSVLPLATEASADEELTSMVEERISQLRLEVRSKLVDLRSKPPRPNSITPSSTLLPPDEALLSTNGFKKRENPNKSTKRLQGKVQKIAATIRKKNKDKSFIEATVVEYMNKL
ncbi:Protein FAR-RED IMPAIRED RESPONSE 1, partial [Linum grandiflorum]